MIDETLLIEDLVCCKGLGRRGLEAVLETINKQPKVGEWIPVSERLPKNWEKVLTCDKEKSIHIMVHHESFKYPFGIHPSNPQYSTPVAWMPLPEPYKE